MKSLVTVDKMSKKARREYYAAQRRSWGNVNPATRTEAGIRDFNRADEKKKTEVLLRRFAEGTY